VIRLCRLVECDAAAANLNSPFDCGKCANSTDDLLIASTAILGSLLSYFDFRSCCKASAGEMHVRLECTVACQMFEFSSRLLAYDVPLFSINFPLNCTEL
jgi:hypothetical protein